MFWNFSGKMVKFRTFSKNVLEFSRSVLEFLSLTKLQKQTTSSGIMAVLKALNALVIYNCSSCSHLIKPSPILAVYAYWYARLSMYACMGVIF